MPNNEIQNTEIAEEQEVYSKTTRVKSNKNIKRKPGRPEGSRTTNPKQEKQFIKQLIEKTPKELNLIDDELWTSLAINKLINKVKRRTINNYLKRWGCTSQFPKEKKGFDEELYTFEMNSQDEKGEIHWLDKKTCTLEFDQKEIKINMISSVTKKKKLRFMLYEQNFNDLIFIEFLKRLIQSSNRKIYLILNNSTLKTENVIDWVNEHKTQINLHVTSHYD